MKLLALALLFSIGQMIGMLQANAAERTFDIGALFYISKCQAYSSTPIGACEATPTALSKVSVPLQKKDVQGDTETWTGTTDSSLIKDGHTFSANITIYQFIRNSSVFETDLMVFVGDLQDSPNITQITVDNGKNSLTDKVTIDGNVVNGSATDGSGKTTEFSYVPVLKLGPAPQN